MASSNASDRQHAGTGEASMNKNSTVKHEMNMAAAKVVCKYHRTQSQKRKLAEVETMTLWAVMDTPRSVALTLKATDTIGTMRTKMQEAIAADKNSPVPGIVIAELHSSPKDCSHCPDVEQCHCCPYLTQRLMVLLKDGCTVSDYNLKDGDEITMCRRDMEWMFQLLSNKHGVIVRTQKEGTRVTRHHRQLIWAYDRDDKQMITQSDAVGANNVAHEKNAVVEKDKVDDETNIWPHDREDKQMIIQNDAVGANNVAHEKNAVVEKDEVDDETVHAPTNIPCGGADACAREGPAGAGLISLSSESDDPPPG